MADIQTGFHARPSAASLTRMLGELRAQADRTQTELLTGRHADVAETLSGRTGEVAEIRLALDRLDRHGEAISLAEGRSDVMAESLRTLRHLAVDIANSAEVAMSGAIGPGTRAVSEQAAEALGLAVTALNASFGGRALFSGDRTDQVPLATADAILDAGRTALMSGVTGRTAYDALRAEYNNAAGTFETFLYTGGTGTAPRVEIGPSEIVGIDIRADDPAIRDVLRNLTALASSFEDTLPLGIEDQRDLARRAITGLREAAEDIATLEARAGATQERIGVVKARGAVETASLTLALNELTGRDQYQTGIELSAIEGTIETLFLTTARLSSLSLANYLR